VPTVPLSLSALSLDILVALDQAALGLGAGPLGRVVEGAPTSVQNNLRALVASGLVRRTSTRYLLAVDAPGAEELVAAALRLAPPAAAMRLVARANPAVEFASEDGGGFVVGLATNADETSLAALDRAIAMIRRDRPATVPPVLRFQMDELSRIIHSAIGLRTRLGAASVVKGAVRVPGRSVPARYANRPGGSLQGS
jgi:hypothetical protein